MDTHNPLKLSEEVQEALASNTPVVALETTVVAHGLPSPDNLEFAHNVGQLVRDQGATPAFIAILSGKPTIGLSTEELAIIADGSSSKASRRDIPALMASGTSGATTVAGTMVCAALAGIEVFATGGIGGVHRGAEHSFDISADLVELGRTPVTVVCSGVKSILDVPRTLEYLETQGVPVIGYQTHEMPTFYVKDSAIPLVSSLATVEQLAAAIRANRDINGAGLVIANPISAEHAIERSDHDKWLLAAEASAERAGISGNAITPWILKELFRLSGGRTLGANISLLLENAALAATTAVVLNATYS